MTISQGGREGNDVGSPKEMKKTGNDVNSGGEIDSIGHSEMVSSVSDKGSLHGLAWLMDVIGLSTLYSHNPLMAIVSMLMVMWVMINRPLTLLFLVLPMMVYWWLA